MSNRTHNNSAANGLRANMVLLMRFSRMAVVLGIAAFAASPSVVFAQSAAVGAEEIPTVSAFNEICYKRLPNVASIGKMAVELAWLGMKADELKAFETGGTLDVLDGWDAQVGERIYRVAVSQGPLLDSQLEMFPDLENGTTTTCTMVLDGLDDASVLAADMQQLAGKAPVSKDVADGDLLTTTWAGGNADVKVFLLSSLGGEKGGFLNVTVLTK